MLGKRVFLQKKCSPYSTAKLEVYSEGNLGKLCRRIRKAGLVPPAGLPRAAPGTLLSILACSHQLIYLGTFFSLRLIKILAYKTPEKKILSASYRKENKKAFIQPPKLQHFLI